MREGDDGEELAFADEEGDGEEFEDGDELEEELLALEESSGEEVADAGEDFSDEIEQVEPVRS